MNAVFVIYPTRNSFGIWSFDDNERSLKGEPLVGNTNLVVDNMVKETHYKLTDQIPLLFSPFPIQNFQVKLRLLESTDIGGSYYYTDKWNMEIWLCPALFKYFPKAPKILYGKVGL